MENGMSAQALFDSYRKALEGQIGKDNRIGKLEHGLSLREWNLYFFAKKGIESPEYEVWCNNQKVRKYCKSGGRLAAFEFQSDLVWFESKLKGKPCMEFRSFPLVLESRSSVIPSTR